MEAEGRAKLNEKFKVMWIIWGAMVAVLLIYVFICHFFGETIRNNLKPDVNIELFRNILSVVAVCELGVIYFIRKIMLGVKSAGSDPTPVPHESEPSTSSYLDKYLIAMIITLTLAESIGIYGLILFLLGDSFKILYIFIAVSGAAMFYYRPKMEELEQLRMSTEVAGVG